MRSRREITELVKESKIVAIVRGVYGEDCLKLVEALRLGGIRLVEVTFDQSAPDRIALTTGAIRMLSAAMAGKMSIGAGTVTSVEMAEAAREAGAEFIVSPDTNSAVIRRTVELGMVSMPGALTPTEILAAYNAGADFVKIFPAGNLGSAYIKAIKAPINHVPLLAVGGISAANAAEFMRAGVAGVGVGGSLVDKSKIKAGLFGDLTAEAEKLVKNIMEV